MTIYVDRMRAAYGRMVMCHMVSDLNTDDELHAMADRIGVARRHHQYPGTYRSHYDICQSKRVLAIRFGAIQLGRRELAMLLRTKREQGGPVAPRGLKHVRDVV